MSRLPLLFLLTALCWLAVLTAVIWLHLDSLGEKSVTHIYWRASLHFLAAEPLYTGIQGFSYWPQSAALLLPFALLPWPVGDLLWRAAGLALLAAGLRRVLPRQHPQAVALAALLCLPGLFTVLLNGQAEPHMLGLLLLAADSEGRGRPWQAACLAALAFWLKPIAIVPLLLLLALRPAFRVPGLLCLAVIGTALLCVGGDPLYGFETFRTAVSHIADGADPGYGRWSDVGGMLARFGLHLTGWESLLPRAVLALFTLAFAAWRLHAWRGEHRALFLVWLGVLWLVLFSPRGETGSYAMLACLLGWLAAYAWVAWRNAELALLFFAGVLLGVENYGDFLLRATDHWFKPALGLLLLPYLLWRLAEPAKTLGQ